MIAGQFDRPAPYAALVEMLEMAVNDAKANEAGGFAKHGHIRDGVAASIIEQARDMLTRVTPA